MALINCPECSNKVSDKALCCPHCGLPSEYFGNPPVEPEVLRSALLSFQRDYGLLFNGTQYIAKSDYIKLKDTYGKLADMLSAPSSDRFLAANAHELDLDYTKFREFAEKLARLEFDVDLYNENFIKAKLIEYKDYFDNIFSGIDPAVILDEEQRRTILTDEDYCLVIAGAGAGKTTTMSAKVKYLVEKLGINPEDIILISFTNKAVDELRDRINDKLALPAKVTTFHAFGYDLLRNTTEKPPVVSMNAYNIISHMFENQIMNNHSLLRKLILFFGYYLDIPESAMEFENLDRYHAFKADQNYETLKSGLGEYNRNVMDWRSKHVRTIHGEYLRSVQEVQIANFLYLNGIEYEYEKPYQYFVEGSRKPYTPDFFISQGDNCCYIEHFGITEDGRNSIYTQKQLAKYIKGAAFKKRLHEQYNTRLITTWSEYNDGRQLIEHLAEELEKSGFLLRPKSDDEVYKKLVTTGKDKYIIKFVLLLIEFIGKFKTNGYNLSTFFVLKKKTDNVRTRLFLDIAQDIFAWYQEELERSNSIDFEDMINEAEKALQEISENGIKFSYKYIIIDEYQDIARQRFNLTKKLATVTGSKVVAVGDDWQSIYAFSGSDITLFTGFLKLMGYGRELQITHTYRNSQQLIDIAGGFVQKNPSQIKKRLISPKTLDRPVVIKVYDDAKNLMKNKADAINEAIEEIIAEHGIKSSILILGRYNFDENHLLITGKFSQLPGGRLKCVKFTHANITYMTAHSSKGLGYDNVILINAEEGKFGFPSQIEDDPVMRLVTVEDRSIGFAEERRLFYVTLTRTKNRVYIAVPINRPSRFIVELIKECGIEYDPRLDIHINNLSGQTTTDSSGRSLPGRNLCPVCGFPLKYIYNKNRGIDLWECTNDPEICDFMTNDKKVMKDIFLCPSCRDGYMLVKKNKGSEHRFYGCTNHKPDGTGCNYMEVLV